MIAEKSIKSIRSLKGLKKTLYLLAVSIQILLLVGVIEINRLTGKKAGVMHHVYFRRSQYEQGIFTDGNLLILSTVGAILGILFTLLLIRAVNKQQSTFRKVQFALVAGLGLAIPLLINSNLFIQMIAYPYMIIALEIVFVIQILVTITVVWLYRN